MNKQNTNIEGGKMSKEKKAKPKVQIIKIKGGKNKLKLKIDD